MEKLDSLKKTRTLALLIGGVVLLQALVDWNNLSNGVTPKISSQWLMAQLDLFLQKNVGNYFLVARELLISSFFFAMAFVAQLQLKKIKY